MSPTTIKFELKWSRLREFFSDSYKILEIKSESLSVDRDKELNKEEPKLIGMAKHEVVSNFMEMCMLINLMYPNEDIVNIIIEKKNVVTPEIRLKGEDCE